MILSRVRSSPHCLKTLISVSATRQPSSPSNDRARRVATRHQSKPRRRLADGPTSIQSRQALFTSGQTRSISSLCVTISTSRDRRFSSRSRWLLTQIVALHFPRSIGRPARSAVASIIRRLAWCGTSQSMSSRCSLLRAISSLEFNACTAVHGALERLVATFPAPRTEL
jgi:hypothetical protein